MNQRTARWISVTVAGILWVAAIGVAAIRPHIEVYLAVWSAAVMATLWALAYLLDQLATARWDRRRASSQAALAEVVTNIRAAVADHAARVETATQAHADQISGQVLTVERFFCLGIRSDSIAKIQAAELNAVDSSDTGPATMYNATN